MTGLSNKDRLRVNGQRASPQQRKLIMLAAQFRYIATYKDSGLNDCSTMNVFEGIVATSG